MMQSSIVGLWATSARITIVCDNTFEEKQERGYLVMFEGARKQKFKITFVILGVSVIVLVISFAYGTWARTQREKEMVPRLAADSMMKALRQYQRQTGQFPDDFGALEERIWKHPKNPDFGPSKRTLTVANYYYVYAKTDPLTCTIWAIPSGPKREEGSTHFLVITPEVIRRWKGPALSKGDIDKIASAPTGDLLNMLGMTEQRIIDQRARGKTSCT